MQTGGTESQPDRIRPLITVVVNKWAQGFDPVTKRRPLDAVGDELTVAHKTSHQAIFPDK
jgi:hypothetical protein